VVLRFSVGQQITTPTGGALPCGLFTQLRVSVEIREPTPANQFGPDGCLLRPLAS
jgi:hypothetical protein